MDESIVEGSEYMGNAEYEFTFSNLRTKCGDLFFGSDLLLWRLFHCNQHTELEDICRLASRGGREGGSLYHIERDERVGLDGGFGGLHL
jgi:hypothetical protein